MECTRAKILHNKMHWQTLVKPKCAFWFDLPNTSLASVMVVITCNNSGNVLKTWEHGIVGLAYGKSNNPRMPDEVIHMGG